MKIQILSFCLLISLSVNTYAQKSKKDYTQFVNPFVGTKNMGHTFPGATLPFGMVQLSPETDSINYEYEGAYNPDVYRYCAGYQYDDPTITGFSHTHFSGTGHSDLGDFLLMPTIGALQLNPGTADRPNSGYRSSFSHQKESASPAYYQVELTDYNINAELTATNRVGFHQYTFPKTEQAHIIFDLISNIYNHKEKNVWTFIRVENDSLITGYRQTNGWARTRTVYFAMKFSKPIKSYGHQKLDKSIYQGFWRKFDESKNFPEMAGKEIRAYFNFEMEEAEKLKIKFALSPTSTRNALLNMETEIPHWNFERVKEESQAVWNKELSRIEAEMMTEADQETFYTALYHSFLGPITYMDVDGSYKGLDQNIHKAEGFTNYTIFSLWDTYRALHPLFNLIQQKRNSDMITSMMAHYNQSVHKMLPIWSHYANENWCMIGYHSVPVIADAIIKGSYQGNYQEALEACINTANQDYYDGISYYKELGYVPEDKNSSSVSKTLEYAYDDWTIAQIANKLNLTEIEKSYRLRALNYKNVYNSESGFMQPKLENGEWRKQFNTMSTHGQGFIEGNAWNYSLYVPHDVDEMINLMGGNEAFGSHLDSLFTMQLDDKHIAETEDITRDGIIGNYVHGNEPGHHIPYLYNWAGQEWKTQERVRMIMRTMYSNTIDGLCGNDDAGQMSAWYIFSALGFYPVAPGSDHYAIGSPLVKSAKLNLENGNTLQIKVKNQSEKNVYIKQIKLNGKIIHTNYLSHKELMQGGELMYVMTDKPN